MGRALLEADTELLPAVVAVASATDEGEVKPLELMLNLALAGEGARGVCVSVLPVCVCATCVCLCCLCVSMLAV
jgi:hypothetical protein